MFINDIMNFDREVVKCYIVYQYIMISYNIYQKYPPSCIILKLCRVLNVNAALSEPSIFRCVRDKTIDAKINNLFTLKGNHGVCLKFVFGFQVIYFSQANYY